MIRVLIASPSPMVRAGLEAVISVGEDLELAGASTDPERLARQVVETDPDIIILEIERRGDDALPDLSFAGGDPHVPSVVILTDDPRGVSVTEALRSGVRAVLPREATAEEILAAIRAAAAGLVVLHPDSISSLLPELTAGPAAVPDLLPVEALTPRESEVLRMMAEGLGNKIIAWRLGISEHTVKFHVASIFSKLNASSRTEAVTLGIRQGLIML